MKEHKKSKGGGHERCELQPRREWGELVLTGPDRAQASSLRLFLYCGLCPRPGREKVPILTLPAFPPAAQGVIFSSRTDTSNPQSLAAHPSPQRPRNPAPQPRLVPLLETGNRKSKDLTPSLLLPVSLPHHSGEPQLLILERPRHRELRQTIPSILVMGPHYHPIPQFLREIWLGSKLKRGWNKWLAHKKKEDPHHLGNGAAKERQQNAYFLPLPPTLAALLPEAQTPSPA